MKSRYIKYNKQQLHNILAVSTHAIKQLRREKCRNKRFWQLVNAREAIINELYCRQAEEWPEILEG
jgi:hypothetical protein